MPYFAVTVEHGPNWDSSRGMREQDEWDAHARCMDALVDEGFIVLGGPQLLAWVRRRARQADAS